MDPAELARWTRFAAKGGIGKCTAIQDCVAEREQDLMFLTNDDITVLMQLPDREDVYLGYCEGVVGHFQGSDVQFRSKLKKPIMTKRSSTVTPKSPPPDSPSPVPSSTSLPRPVSHSSAPPVRNYVAPVQNSPPAHSEFFLSMEPSAVTASSSIFSLPQRHSPQPMHPDEYHTESGAQTTNTVLNKLAPRSEAVDFPRTDSPGDDVVVRPTSPIQDSTPSDPSRHHHPVPKEPFLDYPTSNTRISAAVSDGEVGIGNALLDDWSSTHSSDSGSPVLGNDLSTVSLGSTSDDPVTPIAQPFIPPTRATSLSRSSFESKVRSQSGPGEDDWEGASDIYDDYRYSRQSMLSKVSRYSQISTHSAHITHSAPKVPPVPSSDPRPRHSSESQSSFSTRSARLSKTQPTALDLTPKKADPASSDVPSQNELLLATPPSSFSRPSSFISPALTSSSFSPTWAGVAIALRQRLEKSHRSQGSQGSLNHNLTQKLPEKAEEENPGIANDDNDEVQHQQREPSDSPEPMLEASGSLLVVANNTPSPPSYSPVPSPDDIPSDPPTVAQSELPQPRVQTPSQPQPELQPQTQLRPPPADSRPPDPDSSRTSLFLPHPNAPKPTATSSGPMYARHTSPHHYPPSAPLQNYAVTVIRMAIAAQYGPARKIRPTIYGYCDYDLLSSAGPVPISFSMDPPPKHALVTPKPSAMPLPPPLPKLSFTASSSSSTVSSMPAASASTPPAETGSVSRPNFSPTARPRSRSFSEFNPSSSSSAPEHSLEEGSKLPKNLTSRSSMSRASSTPAAVSPQSPSPLSTTTRTSHAPSPLSLPQNNNIAAPRSSLLSPLSKIARSMSTNDTIPLSPTTARLQPSKAAVPGGTESAASSPTVSRFLSSPDGRVPASPNPKPDARESPLRVRRSVDGNMAHYSDRSEVVSPPPSAIPLARNTSLRAKMSLPNLRGKGSLKGSKDDASSVISGLDSETVQVKDMDFELVRPMIAHIPEVISTRTSGDSAVLSLEAKPDFSLGLLRTDSPTVSLSSGAASEQRSPSAFSEDTSRPRTPKDLESSIDAHRQRELKWVHLMSAVPAAQARKNKKVKKLLLEGVPSSVRYLVWAHLTNSKARGVTGVYAQLGKRGKVPASSEIERDVQTCFADQPRLRSTEGPVFSLLQAYLTMVPDIRYHTALTHIAGHLLLLSPEEDAFWIFVSLMDAHLRPYFSSSNIQMEVDASLFSKALETTDAPLARKMFVDMGISPAAACRPWLCSLFAETLPLNYLHRVWDLFLYEGVPFLLRVGLALCSVCRRHLLESNCEQSLLDHLFHPSSNSLPTVDAFLSLAFSVKLKDDDVRKQRIKMEAQVKRQTQTQTRALSTSGVRVRTMSVSLPRT